MGEKGNVYRLLLDRSLVGSQRNRDHYEGQDTGGWITLRWSLQRMEWLEWAELVGLMTGTNESSCESGNGLLSSIRC
jgi:hypothetical protein